MAFVAFSAQHLLSVLCAKPLFFVGFLTAPSAIRPGSGSPPRLQPGTGVNLNLQKGVLAIQEPKNQPAQGKMTSRHDYLGPGRRSKHRKTADKEPRHGVEVDDALKKIDRYRVHAYDAQRKCPATPHLHIDDPVERGKQG